MIVDVSPFLKRTLTNLLVPQDSIQAPNGSIKIGYTFLSPEYWGTGAIRG